MNVLESCQGRTVVELSGGPTSIYYLTERATFVYFNYSCCDLDISISWFFILVVCCWWRSNRVAPNHNHRRFRLAREFDCSRTRRDDCFGESESLVSDLSFIARDHYQSWLIQEVRKRIGKAFTYPIIFRPVAGVFKRQNHHH